MKRLTALIMAVLLVFCLAACAKNNENPANLSENNINQSENAANSSEKPQNSQTPASLYAPERTVNQNGGVGAVDNLKNTYYKLTSEKKLSVAYIGGSVTSGTGGSNGYCWRTATTAWFKENFKNAEITETNSAWGGTGSYWGFFRADEMLSTGNPDLVFIEFAINDAYAAHDKTHSALYMEGLVRKIRDYNKNCDIVIVLVTDNSGAKRLGTEYEQLLAHKMVAEHYGIPTINVGFALVEEMQKTGNSWDYYVGDVVHPNNKGYKVYADCIAGYLEGWLITSPDKSGLSEHEKPNNDLVSNLSVASEVVKAEELTNYKGFKLINSKDNAVSHIGKTLYGKEGSEIEFEFEGRGLGLLVDAKAIPYINLTVDGTDMGEIRLSDSVSELPLLDNLNYGKHSVKITVTRGEKIVIGGFLVAK